MKNSIKSKLSWHLTYAVIFVFIAETLLFILYHLVEYWGEPEELIEDLGELGVLVSLNLLALPFMLFLTRHLIKKELEPLEEASETAAAIQLGHLSKRIEVENPPEEIEHLAAAFNAAFDRYHSLLTKSQHFNADASHQLRTPLAVMRSAGEVALSKEQSPAEYREVIGSMLEETQHLQKIVTQLLELARISQESLDMEPIAVGALLQRVLDRFTPVLEDFPERVVLHCQTDACILGNEVLLVEAITNILDNALTHTPADKNIRMEAQARDGGVSITLCDEGPGISEVEMTRLADRFYQSEAGHGEGSGLGLAIVKAIAELHDAKLSIRAAEPHGSCVELFFPSTSKV